jgi:GTP cyclohydrolase I
MATPLDAPAPAGPDIEDVQSRPDTRNIAINKVGIKEIRHPVRVSDRSGHEQHTIATFSMYVELPHNFKGTHMSRFVETLNGHEHEISVRTFRLMLQEISGRLDAENGHIEMDFPFFMTKRAPVTGVASLMDYQVGLHGKIESGKTSTEVRVEVPVTSLCPCSKDISDYGAHNQRSKVTVTVTPNVFVWIEEIIELVEAESSSELYGLLKRPDEKYVTERAYDNPKFVEDLVRDIARRLIKDERIEAFTVEAENFESIHNHSAYACITRDKRADDSEGLDPGS